MSTRKTITEVVHSEIGADGTWKPKHKTVTTVTETVERDDEGYTWTPRVPRYNAALLHGQYGYYGPDYSGRLRDFLDNKKEERKRDR